MGVLLLDVLRAVADCLRILMDLIHALVQLWEVCLFIAKSLLGFGQLVEAVVQYSLHCLDDAGVVEKDDLGLLAGFLKLASFQVPGAIPPG